MPLISILSEATSDLTFSHLALTLHFTRIHQIYQGIGDYDKHPYRQKFTLNRLRVKIRHFQFYGKGHCHDLAFFQGQTASERQWYLSQNLNLTLIWIIFCSSLVIISFKSLIKPSLREESSHLAFNSSVWVFNTFKVIKLLIKRLFLV